MFSMSGVLKEGRDDGYVIRAPDTPIIIIDRNHGPSQQYLRAFGKQLMGKSVQIVVTDQSENYWMAQISPEELKNKGFSRVQGRG